MEEQVGALWHRLVTRLAETRYPQAAVRLEEVRHRAGVLFRALGGDGGLQIETAEATVNRGPRGWVERLAGANSKVTLAWRDERALRLPPVLDWLPERALNLDLYLWLAALAAVDDQVPGDWLPRNRRLTRECLARFPGLEPRYRRLVKAHLALRPDPDRLAGQAAERERAIRQALQEPAGSDALHEAPGEPAPVPLWLHPSPPVAPRGAAPGQGEDGERGPSADQTRTLEGLGRRQAERVDSPEADRGLVTVRMENIFTWGEFVRVDRGSEDEDDLGRAEAVARDIDRISVARDRKASGARLRFDLDLPAETEDDLVLSEGIRTPEWDWRKGRLLPEHCRIVPMLADDAPPCALPAHLRRSAGRLRSQFQALAPARAWHRAQPDGQEIDLEAYLRFAADRAAGKGVAGDRLYREMRSGGRDLACLLLADLSLSTDSWVDDRHRVIDVIRDSLFLFAESLAATGDRFAVHGFSSRRRDPVRVHLLKGFDERYDARVRGRIAAVKPGYYTRMGAGIRYASELLKVQPAERRLLLLLSDGKPNDLDRYEGRHGIEDTRHAVQQARALGLQPFCVTIDERGNDYLPHLFGSDGYVVIRRPTDLPSRLPMLYARLTA